MTPEQIAEVCHEANRAITKHAKDVPVQPPWDDSPAEMTVGCVNGVKWRMAHRDAPASAQHEEWMRAKLADGWIFGSVKDAAAKTHPALIPYADLPSAVKAKDAVFTAIVLALSAAAD